MDIKKGISKDKVNRFLRIFVRSLPLLWDRFCHVIFVVFFLFCIAFSAYIWNASILNYVGWSQERKDEFLSSQKNGVVFKQANFDKAVKNIDDRKQTFEGEYQSMKNIFLQY